MIPFKSTAGLPHFVVLFFMTCICLYKTEAQNASDSMPPLVKPAHATDTGKAITGDKTFTFVEQMPEFPGGMAAMNAFIVRNIRYPEQAREESREGKVFIKFVVDTAGNITQVSVAKTSGYEDLDREALRVVKIMPPWSPGKMNGKPVKVAFNLPIRFKLTD